MLLLSVTFANAVLLKNNFEFVVVKFGIGFDVVKLIILVVVEIV